MKRYKSIYAILFALGLGLASIHPAQRHFESKRLFRISQEIAKVEQTRERVKGYFSDNLITPEESKDLYWICRSVSDDNALRDFQHLTDREGARITYELYSLRGEFGYLNRGVKDVSTSDLRARLDELLGDYVSYLQSDEYRDLVRPLSVRERFGRHLIAS